MGNVFAALAVRKRLIRLYFELLAGKLFRTGAERGFVGYIVYFGSLILQYGVNEVARIHCAHRAFVALGNL